MRIHKLSDTYEHLELRFACKSMAGSLSVRKMPSPPPWGRFPFKRVTEQVRKGDPTLRDLNLWYKWAITLVKKQPNN